MRGVDLAVLAVNADAALDTARAVAAALGTTPLLCVASAISFEQGQRDAPRPRRAQPRRAGAGARATRRSPPACTRSPRRTSRTQPDEDALVCGDDETAKALALDLAGRLVGGRALDAGPLASARALEGLTAVIVNLNRRYKAHAGIRVTGRRVIELIPVSRPAGDPEGRRPRRARRRADRAPAPRRARPRAEGGLEGGGPRRADRRLRGVRQGGRARRRRA